jgi:cell division protein FtsW (lipid II flippase)
MDLVFGMLIEEWGLIIACLAVLSIVTLAFFAVRSITSGRSTFYTIGACGATSMLVFQTMLNVFGCTDILPFTGVTFPFVSHGGTSMIVSWALLAFLKSSDTRLHASLAVKGGSRK